MSALSEFFLSARADVVQLELIEISHPSFSQTYRLVQNAVEGVTVTIGGIERTFDYYPMRLAKAGASTSLDNSIQIDFGDLGEVVPSELDLIAAADDFDTKPIVKYYSFRSDDLSAPMIGPLEYEVANLSRNHSGASFEAKAPTINMDQTGELYDLETFPMMRGFL